MVEIAYLVFALVFLSLWLVFYIAFPETRKEMLVVGTFVGVLSVLTAYYWWTTDWWAPLTLTGTLVGVEDFLMGFGAGGVMAVVYEGVYRKHYRMRKSTVARPGGVTLLLLLALLTAWLFWGVGITSFWASTIAMLVVAILMFAFRRDLLMNGLMSGVLMLALSVFPYYVILLMAPEWIPLTYKYEFLSGVHITGIPIEELVFWFLSGLVFGPLYEYWQGMYVRGSRPPVPRLLRRIESWLKL